MLPSPSSALPSPSRRRALSRTHGGPTATASFFSIEGIINGIIATIVTIAFLFLVLRAGPHSAAVSSSQLRERSHLPRLARLAPLDEQFEEIHAFSNFSNWLIPGALMLGRYPYVEPVHCLTRTQGDQQLEQLLLAGITTFVSLQEEVPPQDSFRSWGSGKTGFLPYRPAAESVYASLVKEALQIARDKQNDAASTRARHIVYGSTDPHFHQHLDVGIIRAEAAGQIRDESTRSGIVESTTYSKRRESYASAWREPMDHTEGGTGSSHGGQHAADAAASAATPTSSSPPGKGLRFLHLPIPDLGLPPDPPALGRLLQDLTVRLDEGERVYLHCWGGCGRAGMVGAALLMTAYGVEADEALMRVQRAFYTRGNNQKRCQETDEQFKFIRSRG